MLLAVRLVAGWFGRVVVLCGVTAIIHIGCTCRPAASQLLQSGTFLLYLACVTAAAGGFPQSHTLVSPSVLMPHFTGTWLWAVTEVDVAIRLYQPSGSSLQVDGDSDYQGFSYS